MPTLYQDPRSGNCYKAVLTASHLGIPIKTVDIDVTSGLTRKAEFLAKNPNGRVPLFELDDGRLLPESNAIIWYLAEGSPLIPTDKFARAQMLQWMFFEQYSHEPYVATPRYIVKHLPKDSPRYAELPDRLKRGRDALAVMDAHLKSRSFFVGERYSIADIALYAYTHVAPEGGHDLAPYPNVLAWIGRVAAQPRHIPITYRPPG